MKYYLHRHLFHLNFTTKKETTVIAKYEIMEKVTVKDMREEKLVACLRRAKMLLRKERKGEQEKMGSFTIIPHLISFMFECYLALFCDLTTTCYYRHEANFYIPPYFAWHKITHIRDVCIKVL